MARYREYDYSQGKLIQIQFEKQIVPGTSSSSGRNGNASRSAEIFNERSQQKERFLKIDFFYRFVRLKIFGIDIFQILSYIVLHENSNVNNQIG